MLELGFPLPSSCCPQSKPIEIDMGLFKIAKLRRQQRKVVNNNACFTNRTSYKLGCTYPPPLPVKLAPANLTSTGPGANFRGANSQTRIYM